MTRAKATRFVLIVALLCVEGLAATAQSAARPSSATPDPSRYIRSVLVREHDVVAVTEQGLFRAPKDTKRWERLTSPTDLPLTGYLAESPTEANTLWYLASRHSSWRLAVGRPVGLWRSDDGGRRWQLVNREYDFYTVFLHPNGRLYAITWELGKSKEEKTTIRNRVMTSGDRGLTWRDLTGDLGPGVGLSSVFRDPDHPNLVCVHANVLRGYVLQAEDDSYRWKMTVIWEWMKKHETPESFLAQEQAAGWIYYVYQATLDNYFHYDFGSRTAPPAPRRSAPPCNSYRPRRQ